MRAKNSSRFLWGAATSAHQVEGNTVHSDWWAWEHAGAARAKSGRACDHFHRFRDDFTLASNLGHTAHRLSLEWSRIEPRAGHWNEAALAHYRSVLEALREQGLASFVTLHHFTNPLWFARRGGWRRGDAPALFARYVRCVAQRLGDLVDFWVTVNEPIVYAQQAYWTRRWPPQQHSILSLVRVVRHLASAHRRAYRVIHRLFPRAHVGIAKQFIAYLPERDDRLTDRFSAAVSDWLFNRLFFMLTSRTHDYLGVNYYFATTKRARVVPPSLETVPWRGEVSDLSWPIRPEGLTSVLVSLKRFHLPLYVTENGVADAHDRVRSDFIRDHLRAIEQAQAQGADVRGYLYWSLLDNFEWDLGFAPRFGLVEVDYATMKRTPRPSAFVYKAIIAQAQR